MANIKISDLPAASTVADANEFEINESGSSKKVTGSQINAYVQGKIPTQDTSTWETGVDTTESLISPAKLSDVANQLFTSQVLGEINNSKGVTAVDVFVYDTSKDSDGGAWRKRTQHTSWYNETLNTATRGSRREFPAVAVIVAEATKVTIYDGDDPALPMWMVFNENGGTLHTFWYSGRNASSVSAFNAQLLIGSDGDTWGALRQADFAGDRLSRREDSGLYGYFPVSKRNVAQALPVISTSASASIVNTTINDVAMTVLPDAPIDAATGLPVPTIAVATAGGVSVIKDDGTVVDSNVSVAMNSVAFDENLMVYSASASARLYADITSSISSDGFGPTYRFDSTGSNLPLMFNGGANKVFNGGGEAFSYDAIGVSRYLIDQTNDNNSMVAYTTSTYNTGWMNGDIKGAFLSDTDDTDLTDAELVTNGTFDTDTAWNKGTGWTISGGTASCDGTQTSNSALSQVLTNLTVGATYQVTFDVTVSSGAINYVSFFTFDGGDLTTTQTYSLTVVADNTSELLIIVGNASFVGSVDNVSVKLADADRSVNNNGLIVNGTVTRTPVATGADLVAYSGFSTSNYLEQPYNSDLDFGTGDFCVMGWIDYNGSATYDTIASYGDGTIDNTGWHLRVQTSGAIGWYVGQNFPFAATGAVMGAGKNHFCCVRKDGVAYIYVNGVLQETETLSGTVSVGTNATLQVGECNNNSTITGVTTAPQGGSLALLRISATAPTAEQIKKIYEDEKVLFQENAQATLYGSSDAVTALAHDPVTDLLHVGTSAGRSVFSGLRRVDNTTTAVGTAISASNSLVAEE